ncbi:MAG: histidine kinase [Xanthobacteraceae bacterium]|nr:histidine kinase [Xanthobacteraceae bacterium]
MTNWLPNRIMQTAALLCVGAGVLVFWLVLHQPWLGVTLAPQAEPGAVRIVAVDRNGPARAVPAPTQLAAIGAADASGERIRLEPGDLSEEPDMIESFVMIARFMERQSALARLLRQPRVVLYAMAERDAHDVIVAPAQSRPISDLPSSFWVQLVTGFGSLLLGAWVLALRPRDLPTRLFTLAGVMIMMSAFAAAIYSSRELAIDGGLFRVLAALNHVGALGFGGAMISLFLVYPRRLASPRLLWIPLILTALILMVDILRLQDDQTLVSQLPTVLYMLAIIVLIGLQWFATRRDPRGRAALRWLGLSVIVGAGAFVMLIVAPVLVDTAPVMQQGHAFGFFLLIYAGLALGVSRYRLFDLDEWAFRVMFYTGGVALLLALDALLIYVMNLQHGVSFSIALLALAFIYLPARDSLRARLQPRNRVESHELFREVVDVTFAASPQERSERWHGLLRRLFDPLVMTPLERAVTDVEIAHEGLEVRLPAAADTPALELRYPWRGEHLFGSSDRDLARELVRLMRYVEVSRDAFERGGVEERRRIARDLHDDVGARLLSGLYKTEVTDTHRVLRDALADIRTIVSGLAADHLPLGQVIAALRHEAGERLAAAGIDLHWPLAAVDESTTLLDYRIYRSIVSAHREIVSNVIRHARARRVEVAATQQGRTLSIVITDDGVGIDPANASGSAHGSGLRGIIRRLGDLGGSFVVAPAAHGSICEIRIPLVADAAATDAEADRPHVQGVSAPGGSSYSSPADAAQRMGDRS